MRNQDDNPVERALAAWAAMPDPATPDGFMDGVWMQAGQLEEKASRRTRLALFAAMAFVGLGAGVGTTQTPARAETANYRLVEGADLSPASLLHVEP